MRGTLETRLMPRFSQLADKIQQQQSYLYAVCAFIFMLFRHSLKLLQCWT